MITKDFEQKASKCISDYLAEGKDEIYKERSLKPDTDQELVKLLSLRNEILRMAERSAALDSKTETKSPQQSLAASATTQNVHLSPSDLPIAASTILPCSGTSENKSVQSDPTMASNKKLDLNPLYIDPKIVEENPHFRASYLKVTHLYDMEYKRYIQYVEHLKQLRSEPEPFELSKECQEAIGSMYAQYADLLKMTDVQCANVYYNLTPGMAWLFESLLEIFRDKSYNLRSFAATIAHPSSQQFITCEQNPFKHDALCASDGNGMLLSYSQRPS